MSDLRIPIGLDPYGREVHITEARRGFGYYKCPICSVVLEARRGDILEYFAHLRNTPDADRCPLRTDADVNAYIRLTPIDKRESAKRLWMFIISSPYSDDLRLVAKFRTPSWEDFTDVQQVKQMIGSIRIQSEGALRQPSAEMFHPSRGEAVFELNPVAPNYRIDIRSTPSPRCIGGNWTGEAPRKGDLFVGDWETAEKVESMSNLEPGAVVYFVSDAPLKYAPAKSRTYHLAKLIVTGMELDEESTPWLESMFPDWQPGKGDFAVDVVLPARANPRGYPVVAASPGSEALVALMPPPGGNATFEMVLIPAELRKTLLISTTGPGIPRLQSIQLPKRGFLWASFFWNARHKVLHFQTVDGQQNDSPPASLSMPEIGLKILGSNGEGRVKPPWGTETTIEPAAGLEPADAISLAMPEGLSIGLKGLIDRDGLTWIVRAECPDAASTMETVQTWVEEGCVEIELSFATMGNIVLRLPAPQTFDTIDATIPDISDEEIRARLLAFTGGLPRGATWKVARTILQAPSGTGHHKVPSRLKKRVRRILIELRAGHVD